jgi:hypothetical protein
VEQIREDWERKQCTALKKSKLNAGMKECSESAASIGQFSVKAWAGKDTE